MLSTVPRIARIAAFVLVFGLTACSSGNVPVGTNSGNLGASGSTGGSSGNGGSSPCASAPVSAIGCASGPQVQVCDPSTSPPSWSITCPGESGSSAPSLPASDCSDLAVDAIGCASGEPTYLCDAAGATPHWQILCSGGNTGSPINGGGESPAHPITPDGGSVATACDDSPMELIGCATGETVYTCVADSGAPHWAISCQ